MRSSNEPGIADEVLPDFQNDFLGVRVSVLRVFIKDRCSVSPLLGKMPCVIIFSDVLVHSLG